MITVIPMHYIWVSWMCVAMTAALERREWWGANQLPGLVYLYVYMGSLFIEDGI